ncbi:hypothetical protein CEXT_235801 [Caerostris extrusa]|uniref:Uncharacterized protein n=1 Tax=Caerostris extrusa TaxID=172846 RepID=A0AAV4N6Y1_CAEEX|nr:hypothetical protein CEXT_235801 [Caerostris extrusa]
MCCIWIQWTKVHLHFTIGIIEFTRAHGSWTSWALEECNMPVIDRKRLFMRIAYTVLLSNDLELLLSMIFYQGVRKIYFLTGISNAEEYIVDFKNQLLRAVCGPFGTSQTCIFQGDSIDSHGPEKIVFHQGHSLLPTAKNP